MAEKPADDATDVHDSPDKDETPEECMARHEELHREHRARADKHERFLVGLGMPADDVEGVHDSPDRGDWRRPRRHHD